MKNNIYIFLILLPLPTIAMSQQIVASYPFTIECYGDFYSDPYNIQGHQSIEYVITLARKMKLTVEHCATDNYAYTELKSYINGQHNIISTTCNGLPGLKKFSSTLEPGTYTFTSSGAANADDAILDITFYTDKPDASINGKNSPIDIGALEQGNIKQYSMDSYTYTNSYVGVSNEMGGDIYYRFSLLEQMKVSVNNIADSNITTHFLNSSFELIYESIASTNCAVLPAGTYYVVVEYTAGYDGIIQTIISTLNSDIPTYDDSNQVTFPISDTQRNIVRTATLLIPTAGQNTVNLTMENSILEYLYIDELGRSSEVIQKEYNPDFADIVTLTQYDALGRKEKEWVPICMPSNSGKYVSPNIIESQQTDNAAYNRIIYEDSPLHRIIKQIGSGDAWHSVQKGISTTYSTNSDRDVKLYYVNNSGKLIQSEYYATGELSNMTITDEDGVSNTIFTDKFDRKVLERQGSNDTYFVYDDYNNLSFVLQPMYQENADLSLYAFQYKYNNRNLCIEKKLPGANPIRYVYDQADRLVFMQNGNQGSNQWTFIFYDALGREVIRGLCTANSLPDISNHSMITEFSTSAAGLFQTGYICPEIVKNGINYTKLLTISYYDNYDFLNLSCLATHKSSLSYGFENGTHPTDYTQQYIASPENLSAKGLLTGTGTGLMEENIVLFASLYYDDKDQIVQSRSMNHLGKYEKDFFSYSFSGKVLKHLHIHTANEKEMQTELYTYVYDHAERLQEVRHKLKGNSEVKLAINTYDKLGRLKTKMHHGTSGHKLTYECNIRNWLTQISGILFEQNLYYNTGNGSQCYNGNIGSMTWKSGEDGIRGYKFTYDNMSRMKNAIYGEGTSITPPTGKNFSENVIGYDHNGNITGLQRYGKVSGSTYGKIDDLSLTYVGNQLNNVTDAATDPLYNGAFNFVDGNKTSIQEYKYDANGNLEQDYNKKITKIQYNSLNLPSTLQFANGNSTNYLYGADGMKRRVTHKTAIANISVPMGQIKELASSQISQTNTIDYCSNVIYENGVLNMILTEEGYMTFSGNTPIYHYYLKDHQGNNRIIMNQNGTTAEQVNHYYPFGGLFEEGLATSNQNYKYNSKELDRIHGLDWYDYIARMMDSSLGRFIALDPLAEEYYSISPYLCCVNNPINAIDPDGKSTWVINNSDGTYRVVGGLLEDNDPNIYVYTIEDGQLIRGESIGITTSMTSFYDSDMNGGKGAWAVGSIINPNDQSGKQFLKDFTQNPPNIGFYMDNAKTNQFYDFKVTNGTSQILYKKHEDLYRGMPVKTKKDGTNVYSSARDIGNIAAGYIAGRNSIPWSIARKKYDKLQSQQENRKSVEGISSQNAQYLGWKIGIYNATYSPVAGYPIVNFVNNILNNLFYISTKK